MPARPRLRPAGPSAAVLALAALAAPFAVAQPSWSWQEPHAGVVATGDLVWTPTPFAYAPGPTVYYVDYEGGSDANAGTSPAAPFRHHPWDAAATGNAAATSGPHTYVFKRGVIYRGTLVADESGTADTPIRLTSDPAWGTGEAALFGSERVAGPWRRATAADGVNIPAITQVWYADFAPAIEDAPYGGGAPGPTTQMVAEWADGALTRIPVARAPNWTVTDADYPQKDWYTVESGNVLRVPAGFVTDAAADWLGGTVWTGWGTGSGADANMATYHQGRITGYASRVLTIDVRSDAACRYYVENLPQLLDAPGEFFYRPASSPVHPRRLYLRLPGDRDPNATAIEVAVRNTILRLPGRSHIVVSGLLFALTNQPRPGTVPNPPHWNTGDGANAAIEISGTCSDVAITHCRFRHVVMGIAPRRDDGIPAVRFERLLIADNDLAHIDDQGITLGVKDATGYLRHTRILRNRVDDTGARQTCRWYSSLPAIMVTGATSVEIAGNFVSRSWGQGINLYSTTGDTSAPGAQVRSLVHHNRVDTTLLGTNDWGGIEGWGDGPAFFFNNVSVNPRGYRPFSAENVYNPWGHAIYFDHAHHHYAFNNIVRGTGNSTTQALLRNNSGFMQAASGNNTFANNTVHRFYRGFCFNAEGGTYVGNLLDDVSRHFHDEAAPLSWTSYARNVYRGTPAAFNVGHATFAAFQQYLQAGLAHASSLGFLAGGAVLRDAAGGDFRPVGEARGRGARIFVPWNLARVRGEWHFRRHPADPTTIASTDAPSGGTGNTLACAAATNASFVAGTLEDWTETALRFDGATLYAAATSSTVFNQTTNGFILEAVLRTTASGPILAKATATRGYQLLVTPAGHLRLRLLAPAEYWRDTSVPIHDGAWHHVLVEVDRAAGVVRLWVDGQRQDGAASGAFPAAAASLSNSAEFRVGRDGGSAWFAGDLDFLRVTAATFAEGETSFEELYAWQFAGPAQRDFTGGLVTGPRHAGALHFVASPLAAPFAASLGVADPGPLQMTWPGAYGWDFIISASGDLGGGWTPVATIPGDDALMAHPLPLPSGPVFYRLDAVPAP